jgi:hypothetical protein
MKKILALVLLLIAAIGGGLFWLSGNMDGLIKNAISDYGSAMTQAKVSVDAVKISPADGKGSISNLQIGNPAGFKTSHAMKVAQIDVEIDIGSVTKDLIVIRRIAIKAPDIIYEKADAMTNFDAIQKNIASYLGPADTSKKESKGKKLIVEELTVRDAKAQASAAFMNGKTMTVPLPDITLKDLGKAKGGITPAELGQEVVGALKAKLGAAVSFDRLMKSTGETLDKAGTAIKGLFK